MKDIVEWLIGLEATAGDLYENAGTFFEADAQLSLFLRHLAEDEAWHFHAMGSAAEYLRRNPEKTAPSVTLDEETKRRIEKPFRRNLERLGSGTLTEQSILQCIHDTEFSEWNDLFLYVLNALKAESREFQYVAARLHGHLTSVTEFLATRPGGERYTETLEELPPVWEERVLVVDDDDAVREVIAAILAKQATVETARDGSEGLEKFKSGYFDAVVSDINMPVMDGITFFEHVTRLDPTARARFIFYTGSITENLMGYFRDNDVQFLEKPAPINVLRSTVAGVVKKTATTPS